MEATHAALTAQEQGVVCNALARALTDASLTVEGSLERALFDARMFLGFDDWARLCSRAQHAYWLTCDTLGIRPNFRSTEHTVAWNTEHR